MSLEVGGWISAVSYDILTSERLSSYYESARLVRLKGLIHCESVFPIENPRWWKEIYIYMRVCLCASETQNF